MFSSADLGKLGMAAGAGGIGAGIGGLLFNHNPADEASKYLSQIPSTIEPYFKPYAEAGARQIPGLESQYGNLMNQPGQMLNKIGGSYQQSPGFQFALNQALGARERAAAAGGMVGSPMHQQDAMQLATQMGNQDYYNWLQHALGLYGTGLSGSAGLMGAGQTAGQNMADMLAQALQARSQLEYAGSASQNQGFGGALGNLIGGAGTLMAFL